MNGIIIYSPETMTYTLSNGTDRITLPNWAHRVIRDEFEREVRPLSNKIEILSDALALARTDNAKLRELVARMAEALGIDCEWADPNWCKSNCVLEFGCWPEEERTDIRCPAWAAMRELGVEVD